MPEEHRDSCQNFAPGRTHHCARVYPLLLTELWQWMNGTSAAVEVLAVGGDSCFRV